MSFTALLLYIVIVSVAINSILSIIIKHILFIIFCNDDIDQMLRSNAKEIFGMCFFMLFF